MKLSYYTEVGRTGGMVSSIIPLYSTARGIATSASIRKVKNWEDLHETSDFSQLC
jgi:hypothetical protein